MWHKIALSLWSVAVMLLFFSCKEDFSEKNREEAVLVRIGDKALTRGDLEREIPDRLKSKDSALFADNYIKQWVDDQLLYDVASRNIPDKRQPSALFFRQMSLPYPLKSGLRSVLPRCAPPHHSAPSESETFYSS